MAEIIQKLITTITVDKSGDLKVTIDAWPKLPETMENYYMLSESKQAIIAVANQFYKVNDMLLKELLKVEEKPATMPVREVD